MEMGGGELLSLKQIKLDLSFCLHLEHQFWSLKLFHLSMSWRFFQEETEDEEPEK